MNELKGGDRLLFEAKWDRNPRLQLERAMSDPVYSFSGSEADVAGALVLGACTGRMPQALAAQENALHYRGTPFINAETSWLYYTWLLEYQGGAQREPDDADRGRHVVRALVSEKEGNLGWLGNVPPETVLAIRKQGHAEEVRKILGEGVSGLIGINPDNYYRTADKVVENLEKAFERHQKELANAKRKKLKFYGIDVGSCLAVGGIAVTAAVTANPLLGAASGILGVAGLPNLKDIKTKFSQIKEAEKVRMESPTGLLFQHLR